MAAPGIETSSSTDAMLERLLAHRMLGSAPRQELSWLAQHGKPARFERGETLVAKRERGEDFGLWILFSGHLAVYVDRGAGPKRVMDWHGGDVTGALPYSRLTSAVGSRVGIEAGDFLYLDRKYFPDLIRECPEITTRLVHVMLDRARQFTSSDLHDEKMISLGKLAAGLAHELNNPASAAARSAALAEEALGAVVTASRDLGAARLPAAHMAALDRFRTACAQRAAAESSSPIERAEREDAITNWLQAHDVDASAAVTLTESGVTVAMLDELAAQLDATLDPAVRWIAAECSSRTLLAEVRKAAARIYDLVGAVKRYTYMDRSPASELVDVVQGLQDTVAVLRAKARSKEADLTLDVAESLAPVRAVGGELNQIWWNVIDNALDAVRVGGHVSISACAELNTVVIRVIDDGRGFPPELIDRIFDPFFTTKPAGQATGLGLDIARRLARRHQGDIEAESRTGGGHTEFRIILPASRPDAAA